MRTSHQCCLSAALLTTVLTAFTRAADPPPDLALIPPNAIAFAHIRIADLWNSDAFADYRNAYLKSGPDVLAKLDAQFAPAPSTIELTSLILLPPEKPGREPLVISVSRYSKPFDKKRVIAGFAQKSKQVMSGGKEFHVDEGEEVAIWFADNQTFVISNPAGVRAILTRKSGTPAKLLGAITQVGKHYITVAVDTERLPLPQDAIDQVPPPFRPLLKTGLVTMTAGGGDGRLKVRAEYTTEADAKAAEKAVRDAIGMARGFLVQGRQQAERGLAGPPPGGPPRPLDQLPEAIGSVVALGLINTMDEFLANPPVQRSGTALTLETEVPASLTRNLGAAPVLAGLLLPAVQKVREAAARATSTNNLKQIALAMHNYHDIYQRFPAAAIADKKTGKPLLSWRVAILPYVEQNALYKQFKLDEPWDSEHNKKLIPLMPKLYADPRLGPEPGKTIYKVFVKAKGDFETAFGLTEGRRFTAIADGTSNTILVVAAGESVEWTKPEDIPYDPSVPLPDLTRPSPNLLAAFCDGSVRALGKIDDATLRAMITANGAEVFQFP